MANKKQKLIYSAEYSFFIHPNVFFSFLGFKDLFPHKSHITALESTGIDPFVEKTYRKMMTGDITKTMMKRLSNLDVPKVKSQSQLPDKCSFFHVLWEYVNLSFKGNGSEDFFLSRAYELLIKDSQLSCRCFQPERDSTDKNLHFWSSQYAVEFILAPYKLSYIPSIENMKQYQFLGQLSVILHLIAAWEIDLKSSYELQVTDKSDVISYLPEYVDGKWVLPFKKLVVDWQNRFDINSQEEVADVIPTKSETDIEDRARKLKKWLAGQHRPSLDLLISDDTLDWLKAITKSQSKDLILRELIKLNITFALQEVLRWMNKVSGKPNGLAKIPQEVFNTYEYHFLKNYEIYKKREQ
ncbi:hypothetical protein [Thiomicrorhabdus lithotrophica]|uniref:Uncharacterized protein n=1 Tax=Thiomicrorhabdus lithotrophica TaxID=2949997 RepID=A0ABY8C7D0_9GAMM|nr:hypothetical protein [Thiomicrorhabdus lithotrophica]WEJ61874.1 hypothetical protein NR989_07585 [Thiomicrorhabdus lithotrophica]